MGRRAIFGWDLCMADDCLLMLSPYLSANVTSTKVSKPFVFQDSSKSGKVGKSGGQENSEHEVGQPNAPSQRLREDRGL